MYGVAGVFIGIDLAWGQRAPTGIAVLDAGGELICLAAAGSDEQIDEILAPWIDGPCVVGLDAPLLVLNPTGRRACEAELTRAFGAQHAGAYPTNTGMAHFAGGGRGAQLARRHGLDIVATTPFAAGQRRALEVYPHSAAVALFDLDFVLKYKARSGRSLETRRVALDRLVELLTTLADRPGLPRLAAADGFASLRTQIAQTPTGAALRRLEDPIDAIVCAYVARLFVEGLTHVFGDAENGAIVTPIQERHRELLDLRAPCAAHARTPSSGICCADCPH
jgi:predicted RNase H-like nuclease